MSKLNEGCSMSIDSPQCCLHFTQSIILITMP